MQTKKCIFISFLVVFILASAGWEASSQKGPILIEAPMKIEADVLIKKLEHKKVEKSGSFVFYIGEIDDAPVIVAKTGMGMENSAAATAIAIEKYKPVAIINQGTSGGHDPNLHVFDIVLGKRVTNIGSFKTPKRAENKGSKPLKWIPIDLIGPEGGLDVIAENIRFYTGDKTLLTSAKEAKDTYKKGTIKEGTIGSSDVWNNEVDRLQWFHSKYGTSVEEMEAAAAAQIAAQYHVPFLGIRIISNNELNNDTYNPQTAVSIQEYVLAVVKKYISMKSNPD